MSVSHGGHWWSDQVGGIPPLLVMTSVGATEDETPSSAGQRRREGQGDGHAGAAGRQTPGLETAEAQALRTRAPRGDVIASENERRRLSSTHWS
jgi:hypothetical protein